MRETAIIFGVNGQDGYFLAERCRDRGLDVIGVSRTKGEVIGDVADFDLVESLISDHQPRFVFQLSANSSTSHDALTENHAAIATGSLNVLEAIYRNSPESRVLIVGSGVQFKNSGEAIRESDEFEATSPYSVARIHATYAARYFRRLGIRAYVAYLFHHESPLRKKHHVSQIVVQAAKRAAAGERFRLEMGDISVRKEWTYADDVTEAMMMLLKQEDLFEAVIGSGITYSIEDWLVECFRIAGKPWQDYIDVKEVFTPEYPLLVSQPSAMMNLGWRPKTSFEVLAQKMMRG